MQSFRFIIYGSIFSERSGGAMALHALCHHLNKNGHSASVYFKPNVVKTFKDLWSALLPFLNFFGKHFLHVHYFRLRVKHAFASSFYSTLKTFNAPIFKGKITSDDIVVYPEIVDGNPLKAKNIVRWFLHKPGFHTGRINYGLGELYFYYQESFNNESLNPFKNNLLRLTHVRHDIFNNRNSEKREGSCYAIRKGKGKPIKHDLKNSILIDNLNLKQISDVFNQCEWFYSYDTKTSYSRYAVLCGCKSVVIPDEGVSAEQWQPEEFMRYGIAYGLDDLEYAEKTKHLVFDTLKRMQTENDGMVIHFASKCMKFFEKDSLKS